MYAPSGFIAVRENSGRKLFSQGQGKVREFCQKSGRNEISNIYDEKSGNFCFGQGEMGNEYFFIAISLIFDKIKVVSSRLNLLCDALTRTQKQKAMKMLIHFFLYSLNSMVLSFKRLANSTPLIH